jgi:hypothetical protein
MPEKINWTLNVQVVGGPKMAASETVTVDAYDKIQVTVDAGEDKAVEVQPGGDDRVQFLLINSNQSDDKLTYKVGTATEDIKLDAPQLFIGDGAVGLLGEAPGKLSFSNGLSEAASIEILVGRKVTA